MTSTSAGSGGPPRGPQFDNRRIAAGLIDLVTVAAVAIVVGFVVGFIAGPDKEAGSAVPVLVLAWALFYYFALESGNGQTLGKRIMGLRVLTADGRPASMGEIGVRTVLRIIDGIGLYLVGLITMIATGQRRQRLGDLAAKTVVTSADWKLTAGAQTTAAQAATPATSAIVLPTAPAAPELPTAAVPSPFTPLASDVPEPPSVTPEPPALAPLPVESAPVAEVPEPPNVTAEPPALAPLPVESAPVADVPEPPEPPAAVESVELAATPPVWNPEPVAVEPDPPSVGDDPAPVKDPIVDGPADGTWEPLPLPAAASEPASAEQPEELDEDEPVRVRSVETMSAMDLLMSELEEDEPAGHRPAS